MKLHDTLTQTLDEIVSTQRVAFQQKLSGRAKLLLEDNSDHYELYGLLGVSSAAGFRIDLGQNTSRLLTSHAGRLMERLSSEILSVTRPGRKHTILNPYAKAGKGKKKDGRFEIDWLVEGEDRAYEIKWRDGTTDWNHVQKEISRVRAVKKSGYHPVRVMYYIPSRDSQQQSLKYVHDAIHDVGGEVYTGPDAYRHIHDYTGFDFLRYVRTRLQQFAFTPLPKRTNTSPLDPNIIKEQCLSGGPMMFLGFFTNLVHLSLDHASEVLQEAAEDELQLLQVRHIAPLLRSENSLHRLTAIQMTGYTLDHLEAYEKESETQKAEVVQPVTAVPTSVATPRPKGVIVPRKKR